MSADINIGFIFIKFKNAIYLCNSLKNSLVILLLAAFLTQSFSRSLVLADYMINLDAYKKACENKAKPMLHCNGKCQMFKKIKKQEGDNGANATAPKFNQPDIVLSSKSFFPTIERAILKNKNRYFTYNCAVPTNHLSSIFQPPGV